ncbi:MAG: hypothetical protein WAM14_27250 [Candidatus Nitrosopolaris sp.]
MMDDTSHTSHISLIFAGNGALSVIYRSNLVVVVIKFYCIEFISNDLTRCSYWLHINGNTVLTNFAMDYATIDVHCSPVNNSELGKDNQWKNDSYRLAIS